MKKNSIKNAIKRFSKILQTIILKNIGVVWSKKYLKEKFGCRSRRFGCPLILYLAYSGVGNLGIADHDKIELSKFK